MYILEMMKAKITGVFHGSQLEKILKKQNTAVFTGFLIQDMNVNITILKQARH